MSGLVCPNCGQRGFGIVKSRSKNKYDSRRRESALFGCDFCDYKEII